MNCLEFRRAFLTNPYDMDEAQRAHIDECDTCARFAVETAGQDRRLQQAMRVPVPENLATDIIFRRSLSGSPRFRMFAVAATVCLAVAMGAGGLKYAGTSDLDRELIAHMDSDPLHTLAPASNAQRELRRISQQLDVQVREDIGGLSHASLCLIEGRPGAHLVLGDERAQVTAYLLPRHSVWWSQRVQHGDQHGLLVPADGGVIALFGPNQQVLEEYRERIHAAVGWHA